MKDDAEQPRRAARDDDAPPGTPTLVDSDLGLAPGSDGGPSVGDRFGHYHVLRRLGAGAMGTVVEAYDETLDRKVAIKLLHERRREGQERRLLREAQALARLSHPNVVQVYEVGEAAGHLFIAMELVVGQPLDRWQREPRRWREVVAAYAQAARGLAAAHAQGLVHRDFKPGNCIIDEEGRVKVLDFGLARESSARTEEVAAQALLELTESSGHESNRALSESLTRTGTVLGTPAYMAPEQLRGRNVGPGTDQFNFCVSLYEALYGVRPFAHRSIGELVTAVLGGELRPPPRPSRVPRALWPILRRGLAHEPDARWPSMDAVIERLERALDRRLRRGGLVGVGLVAATAGGVLWGRREGPEPCRGAAAQLADTWNEARAGAVGNALVATGVPYADATRERVTALLEAHAAAWIGSHTAACEATTVHGQQSEHVLDLRMRCLAQDRGALARTVGLLEAADAAMVERAVSMVASLPSPARCDDVDALQAALPPPEDAGVAAEVDAVREQLAGVRVLQAADRTREALAVIEPLVERAEALGYPPLVAEVRLMHGNVLLEEARYPEAEAELTAAYALATELGHEETAARAAQLLAEVLGQHLANHPVGRAWGVTAESLARRVEPDGPQHAFALRTIAIVQVYQGQIDQAAERFEHALRIWEALPDAGIRLAHALGDMGNLRFQQGRLDEALAFYARAAEIRRVELGEGHPDLGVGAINVGQVYEAQGRLDEAAAEYRRALEVWKQTRADDHPSIATVLNNLAVVLDKQGKPDDALALYERVLAIRERALGPKHPYVAQTHANIALALRAKGEAERALEQARRALAIFEEIGDPDALRALYELSEIELAFGRLDEARAHRERYIAGIRERHGEGSHQYAFAELGLADVGWAQGERTEARALAEQAHARVREGEGPAAGLREAVEQWLSEHPETEVSVGAEAPAPGKAH